MKCSIIIWVSAIILLIMMGMNCGTVEEQPDILTRLTQWRQGVWISGEGSYTIYTDSHYFVVSFEGDSTNSNIYVGASQIAFHAKGIARNQTIRIRQLPGAAINVNRWTQFTESHQELPLDVDTTQFRQGACAIKEGIIYDAVTAVTDTSIILATCNGDQEIIYSNGVSAYCPAGGGEYLSYRIEIFAGK